MTTPPPITISPFLLLCLVRCIGDLKDALAACHQTVAAKQQEFRDERAECPRRPS